MPRVRAAGSLFKARRSVYDNMLRLFFWARRNQGVKMDNLLTAGEAAKRLRVCRHTVYSRIRSGRLPAYRLGGSLRIKADDLARYVDGARIGTRGAA